MLGTSESRPASSGEAKALDEESLRKLLVKVSNKEKAASLLGAMSDAEKWAAHAYLSDKHTDLKGVGKVLHFGDKKQRKGSTPGHRLVVRRKLLEFLAAGASMDAALNERAKLLGLTAEHIGDLKPVGMRFGAMRLAPMLGGLGVPSQNEGLPQQAVDQIAAIFDDVMSNVKYNSAAVPLRFIAAMRRARERDPRARVADVFNAMGPDDELFDAAGGADCVGMAAIVRDRLADIGIGCHVIGTTKGNYLNQLPAHARDARERVGWEQARDFAVYSHASVVVPYTDERGVPRAIHIETGVGPDRRWFSQFLTLAEAADKLTAQQYDLSTAIDPAELAKRHVRCKWRMYLSDTADQSRKVFIDLIEGSIWMSGAPADEIRRFKGFGEAQLVEGTTLRFEEALRAPDAVVDIVTDQDDVMRMSSKEAVELFFRVVALKFGLPQDSFVQEMMWLAQNLAEFRQTVMLDPVAVISDILPLRRQAVAARDKCDRATGRSAENRDRAKDAVAQAEDTMRQALTVANRGDARAAAALYRAAIGQWDRARMLAEGVSEAKELVLGGSEK